MGGTTLSTSSATDKLEKDLRQAITSGAMEPGVRLTPLRDVAREYGITYGKAQRIIRKLQDDGLLSSKRGGGTFVADQVSERAERILQVAPAGEKDVAVVVAPRFYWQMGIDVWVTEFVRGLETTLRRAGSSLQMVFEEALGDSADADTRDWPRTVVFAGVGEGRADETRRGDSFVSQVRSLTKAGHSVIAISNGPSLADEALVLDFDGRSGTRSALRHLRLLGHTAIVYASWNLSAEPSSDWWADERIEAYAGALNDDDLDPMVLKTAAAPVGAKQGSIDDLLDALLESKPRPTAVMCVNDTLARLVIDGCRERNVRVPEDLSVIGFDDDAGAVAYGITTLHRSYAALGRLAADFVLRSAEPQYSGCRGRITVEPQLVLRRSSGPPGPQG